MTISKTNYTETFERAAGEYDLNIALPGCISISDTINVSQDVTITKTLMAGTAAITFVMPSVSTAAHRDVTDKVELIPLTEVEDAAEADYAIEDGEWKSPASASADAKFYTAGDAVATNLGYTGDKLNAPTYSLVGENAANYAELTAPKYFLLKSTYKYLNDQLDLVTIGVANYTDNAGITVNASSGTQDYFIVTVVVTGPAQPEITVA